MNKIKQKIAIIDKYWDMISSNKKKYNTERKKLKWKITNSKNDYSVKIVKLKEKIEWDENENMENILSNI